MRCPSLRSAAAATWRSTENRDRQPGASCSPATTWACRISNQQSKPGSGAWSRYSSNLTPNPFPRGKGNRIKESHIVDDRFAELRALQQLRAGHQALEVVGHLFLADGFLEAADDAVGNLLPSHARTSAHPTG